MNALDVLLVNPNYPTFYTHKDTGVMLYNRVRQPLELAYVASLLEEEGLGVTIIDGNAFEISLQELEDRIKKMNAKIAIVTTQSFDGWNCPFPDYSHALLTINTIKTTLPETLVVAIGPHGTSRPHEVLHHCNADVLIRGEPELIARELVIRYLKGENWRKTPGIMFLKNGETVSTMGRGFVENLDSLPLPAYHFLPMDKYYHDFLPEKKFSIINTSRGCPYRCIFCYRTLCGRSYRCRSVENVIQEIELLHNEFNVKSIYFQDLEFALKKERAKDLCQELLKRRYDLAWGCTMRVDSVNEEILNLMAKSGCKFISYGVESADEEVLRKIKKDITIDQIRRAVALTKQVGVLPDLNFMIGLPGDSVEKFKKSWHFYKSLDPYSIGASVTIPYPDTELYALGLVEGKIQDKTWGAIPNGAGLIGNEFTKEAVRRMMLKQTIRARCWFFKKEYGSLFFLNPRFLRWTLTLARRSL